MECWHCQRPACGVCRFCGRAVCKEHHKLLPYVVAAYPASTGKTEAIVVADALWCGACKPKEAPVPLDEVE